MSQLIQGFLNGPDGNALEGKLLFITKASNSDSDVVQETSLSYGLVQNIAYNYSVTLADGVYDVLLSVSGGIYAKLGTITITPQASSDLLVLLSIGGVDVATMQIAALYDVAINNPADGQVLGFDGVNSQWVNIALAAADPNTLKSNETAELSVAYTAAVYNAGTKSSGSFQPLVANGVFQKAGNGGNHTLTPPSGNCNIVVKYTNTAFAGVITTSGFSAIKGDDFTATSGDVFLCNIITLDGNSVMYVTAI
ncbi:MAG: hypothetical protein MK052_05540 [Alphaproteobacteria bacterium]|nr:hypothetical protein [Alphaproteobacteria bacterium]